MSQFRRIAPLMVSTAVMACASVGCNGPGKKKDAQSLEPPVMAQDTEEGAIAKAQVPMTDASEADLVEEAGRMREQYRQALATLLAYYRRYGYFEKARWAQQEIADLRDITHYPYLGDHVMASKQYAPKEAVADADTLYEQARKLHKEGSGLSGLIDGKQKIAQALELYRRVIDQHPTSDKIDDAAFFAGQIYASDAYREYTLALNYYQRCLKWNPNTEHPAKFWMAYVYDYRLRDREKAIALYKEVIDSSPNRSNVRFAQERIRQLTDRGSHEAPDVEPGVRG